MPIGGRLVRVGNAQHFVVGEQVPDDGRADRFARTLNGVAVGQSSFETGLRHLALRFVPAGDPLEYDSRLQVARWRGASTANLERKGGARIHILMQRNGQGLQARARAGC